jgi:hypothetical protein
VRFDLEFLLLLSCHTSDFGTIRIRAVSIPVDPMNITDKSSSRIQSRVYSV